MDYDYRNDPAHNASLLGQSKVGELRRHRAVQMANGASAKAALQECLSGVDNMSVVDKYHVSKGTQGSIINKALGGRFGPVKG